MNYISWGTLIRDMYPLLSISTNFSDTVQQSLVSCPDNKTTENPSGDIRSKVGVYADIDGMQL